MLFGIIQFINVGHGQDTFHIGSIFLISCSILNFKREGISFGIEDLQLIFYILFFD